MEMHAQHSQDLSTIIIDKDKLLGIENEIFQTLIQESIKNGSQNVSIDLSNVRFISSLGIGILVYAYTTCKNKNIVLNVTNANADIMNVFHHLKLIDIFNIS
jgi:anti-anti-sigma factor